MNLYRNASSNELISGKGWRRNVTEVLLVAIGPQVSTSAPGAGRWFKLFAPLQQTSRICMVDCHPRDRQETDLELLIATF